MYNQFDTELVESLMQLGKTSVIIITIIIIIIINIHA